MPNDCSPVYCVLSATNPHEAAVGNQDRDAIVVRDIYSSIATAERKAQDMRQAVFKALAGDPNPNAGYVQRMLAYRETISVEQRWMHRWQREE